jgi:type VI secretion system secreted protein Hcp
MPAYIKFPDINGEVQEQDHQKWIELESVSMPVFRSIAEGATGAQREKGETSLGDFVVVKQWDISTPLIAEAAAKGKNFREVKIQLCSTINNKNVCNLEIKLKNVIISGWSFSGNGKQEPLPTEHMTLNYTKVEWNYKEYDDMGDEAGNYPASYDTQASG